MYHFYEHVTFEKSLNSSFIDLLKEGCVHRVEFRPIALWVVFIGWWLKHCLRGFLRWWILLCCDLKMPLWVGDKSLIRFCWKT